MGLKAVSTSAGGGGGGGGGTIGQPVTGGTPNEVLFVDEFGNLGQSSNLQFNAPFQALILNGQEQIIRDAVAGTIGPGLTLQNTTAALAGARIQIPPYLYFLGRHWNGTSSVTTGYRMGVNHNNGNNINPILRIDSTVDGSIFTNILSLNGTQATLTADLKVGTGTSFGISCMGSGQITRDFYAGEGGAFNGNVRFQNTNGTTEIILTVPSNADAYTLTLPSAQGAAGSSPINDGSGNLYWSTKVITPPGTTGDQTINATSGSVNFAALGATITVTNSYVGPNSLISVQQQQDDVTMMSARLISKTIGSFVIGVDSPPTAETPVAFWIT